MIRPLLLLAALSCPCLTASATEWDDLRAQYQFCTVIGGLGAGNGDFNPNEWNNAEGQPALSAELSEPHSAMADIHGRVFVADKNAHAVRRIDPDGTIHTVAGMNLGELSGINGGFDGDGPARQHLLNWPQNAYVLPDGTFYILDSLNMRIRRVDTAGIMTTVITDTVILFRGLWVSRDEQVIYYTTTNDLRRWTPALGNAPGEIVASGLVESGNIDIDAAGNIYVSDRDACAIYRVPPTYGGGVVTDSLRVAGLGSGSIVDSGRLSSGLPATQVGLREVRGVAFHPLGGYFAVTHRGGDLWYVDTAGLAWLFVEGDRSHTHIPGSVPVPTTGIIMSEPRSVTCSLSGDVFIACNDAGFIRRVQNVLPPPAAPAWESQTMLPGVGNRLRWQSTAGQWYFVERSPDLRTGIWPPLATLPAAGSLTEFTDTDALTNFRGFYRLRSFRAWPN